MKYTAAGDSAPPFRYDAALAEKIETSWQDYWEREKTFAISNPVGDLAAASPADASADTTEADTSGSTRTVRETAYVMDMFPYPSGKGLHVGHPKGYLATDIYARFRRMQGAQVMHALAYDSFGLPAEQYAVQTGQHPRVTTEENIANMRSQLRRLGLGHDPHRTFSTTDDDYVRWTQWIFLELFNSWYDPEANNGRGSARPIAELIQQFEQGRDTGSGRAWQEMDYREREDLLQNYRLAYISLSPVNWCPGLGTVLANEEVTAEGRSERGNFPVFPRKLRQWNLRITAYADRLIDDLEGLNWPDAAKRAQKNWIGRSVGATISFTSATSGEAACPPIEVYTTRPDTLFGATYVVLSPEHPLLSTYTQDEWPEPQEDSGTGLPEVWTAGAATPREAIRLYQEQARTKTADERHNAKTKTGVFTGTWVTNPATGKPIPVFVSDYVLMSYGTGAIMGVPAEDPRDWEFAQQYDLPYVRTVQPPQGHDEDSAYTGDGTKINSANADIDLNALAVSEAKDRMLSWLESRGAARATRQYKLRDWLFSRQRYWGEPFPIVYDEDGVPHALSPDMLPVTLPEVEDFSPRTFAPEDADSQPETPLSRREDWVQVRLNLGDGEKIYYRDTNTMPNWAGSSWYQLRYADPHNSEYLVAPENEAYWLGPKADAPQGGADLYIGGVEHLVLHLLYARFWHKVLFDLGHISSSEPFHTLVNQGYVEAFAYTDSRGVYVPAEEVTEVTHDDGTHVFLYNGEEVTQEYGKMGKSLKNMVTPEQMYAEYGADTFRVYEMSMGPLEVSQTWDTRAVIGAHRFLQRVWRLVVDEETGDTLVEDSEADTETVRLLHETIYGVGDDYAHMRFNTAIAKLIVLTNHLTKTAGSRAIQRSVIEPLAQMLAPVAPHIAEEMWYRLGHRQSITYEPFPQYDDTYLVAQTVTCVVQVNGKVRERLSVSPEITAEELQEQALRAPGVVRSLNGAAIRRVIVKEPKLVNIVPEK